MTEKKDEVKITKLPYSPKNAGEDEETHSQRWSLYYSGAMDPHTAEEPYSKEDY